MIFNIDPVIFSIGGVPILRWYSLAYIAGFLIAGFLVKYYNCKYNIYKNPADIDSMANYAIIGVILGGRLGYVLFYNFAYFSHHLLEILMIWHGGMSFHGGLIGVIVAMSIFAKRYNISKLLLGDILVISATPGLFFGRIANFINGELWGKHTNSSIGFIFPQSGDLLPRYPSQLYESFCEGLILFFILFFLERKNHKNGTIFAAFFICYGFFRFCIEFVREPDAQIGYIAWSWMTMGHILCMCMMAFGFIIVKILPSKS